MRLNNDNATLLILNYQNVRLIGIYKLEEQLFEEIVKYYNDFLYEELEMLKQQ